MNFEVLKKEIHSDYLPFFERFEINCDFESVIKSVWLTGYILITWEWDYNFWETLDVTVYKSGSYE